MHSRPIEGSRGGLGLNLPEKEMFLHQPSDHEGWSGIPFLWEIVINSPSAAAYFNAELGQGCNDEPYSIWLFQSSGASIDSHVQR